MKNNISDWDAKKAFTTKYLYQNNYIPQIYIDDYWNYYIEEYNLTQVWDNFLKQFKDDNLTYTSYMDEYNRLLDEVPKLFTIESDKNKIVDIIDKRLSTKENSVISYIEGLYTLPEGNYITVDIHSAFDEALKYIGVFNPSYISTNDIINNTSKYSIFNGNKKLRIDIYYHLFDVFTTKEIFKIYCEILLENIYKSDQKLKDIKELTLIGKTQGDSYFYKINDKYDVTEILAVDLIGTILDDEQIVIATNQGEPLSGKASQAEEEYMNICKRILGEDIPFVDINRKQGFFRKLSSIFKK